MKIVSGEELDKIFNKMVKELKPDLFIEAGAWDGSQALRVKQTIPSCEVHAYEANKYNYQSFEQTFHNSDAMYHNIALSDKFGTATFKIQLTHNNSIVPKTKKNNSLKARTDNAQYEDVKVRLDTIDNRHINGGHKKVVLWVDVEGVGLEVLRGSEKILANTKIIKIEVESYKFWEDQYLDTDIISYLESHGFKAEYKDEERTNQYNIIFVK